MTAETIRDEVDDAIRERSNQDGAWDLMDVLRDVVERIDHQVSRRYAEPPTDEAARRCLNTGFVHERLGAHIREVQHGLKRIETREDGEPILVYEQRRPWS